MDVLYRMDALLPPDSLLVADGGDFVGTAAYIVRPRRPLSWLDPGEDPHSAPPPLWGRTHSRGVTLVAAVPAGAFGTLGVGGGFALGAKLCRPEAEVWGGGWGVQRGGGRSVGGSGAACGVCHPPGCHLAGLGHLR